MGGIYRLFLWVGNGEYAPEPDDQERDTKNAIQDVYFLEGATTVLVAGLQSPFVPVAE